MFLIEFLVFSVVAIQTAVLSQRSDVDDLLPMRDSEQSQYDYQMSVDTEIALDIMDRHPVNHPIGTMSNNSNYYHH